MSTNAAHILTVIEQISAGWLAGDENQFAASFAPHAHFVAFDGNILTGPMDIASFHQMAFDSHLRGTELDIAVPEIRPVASNVWLVLLKVELKGRTELWENSRVNQHRCSSLNGRPR